LKKHRVTFSKSITIYADSEKEAKEGAIAQIEDAILNDEDIDKIFNVKVWTKDE